mmetsp:Transcript_11470/g.33581  ORF Transcript_11470/g.33581 Transcript_11470/m.33581 type:complete len:429 (+) Transcript_11470:1076-2362(+)
MPPSSTSRSPFRRSATAALCSEALIADFSFCTCDSCVESFRFIPSTESFSSALFFIWASRAFSSSLILAEALLLTFAVFPSPSASWRRRSCSAFCMSATTTSSCCERSCAPRARCTSCTRWRSASCMPATRSSSSWICCTWSLMTALSSATFSGGAAFASTSTSICCSCCMCAALPWSVILRSSTVASSSALRLLITFMASCISATFLDCAPSCAETDCCSCEICSMCPFLACFCSLTTASSSALRRARSSSSISRFEWVSSCMAVICCSCAICATWPCSSCVSSSSRSSSSAVSCTLPSSSARRAACTFSARSAVRSCTSSSSLRRRCCAATSSSSSRPSDRVALCSASCCWSRAIWATWPLSACFSSLFEASTSAQRRAHRSAASSASDKRWAWICSSCCCCCRRAAICCRCSRSASRMSSSMASS